VERVRSVTGRARKACALHKKNHTVEKEREKKRKLDLRIFLSWHLLFFSGKKKSQKHQSFFNIIFFFDDFFAT
jgi:hypothetical protein